MSRSGSLAGGIWLLVAALLLASCSGVPLKEREAARRAQFAAYAGKPVSHFTWLTRYDGWEPIARNQLVIWTGINQAYLITVSSPCTDLMFARGIALTPTVNTIYAHFDSVHTEGWRCIIDTIQPIDYRRMQQDLRRQRQAAADAQARKPGA